MPNFGWFIEKEERSKCKEEEKAANRSINLNKTSRVREQTSECDWCNKCLRLNTAIPNYLASLRFLLFIHVCRNWGR